MILHIILLILKIIGIVLLSILGILLALIILILFVPVRYKGKGIVKKEESIVVKGQVKISYLLHIVTFSINYDEQIVSKLKIFGIPIPERKKKDKADHKRTKESTKADEDISDTELATQEKEFDCEQTEATQTADEQSSDPIATDDQETNDQATDDQATDNQATDDQATDNPPTIKGFVSWIKKLLGIVKTSCANILYTIKSICDKIKQIFQNIAYYKELLTSSLFKDTYAKCKKLLGHVLKSILPRKWDINIRLGLTDPALMADVLAVHGMLYALLYKHIHLQGYFEEDIIDVDGYFKGKITLFIVIKALLILYFNKDIRTLYRMFKKEES